MLGSRTHRPSAAMVVALLALFFSLTGTAVGAAIVAKARFALNAGKLQGKSAAQVAAMPGPASSVRGLVSVASREFFALPGSGTTEPVSCSSGRAVGVRLQAVGGGQAVPISIEETSETTWRVEILNLRGDGPARGTIVLTCVS